MAVQEGVVAHLMADSDVTDLIGTRLFPLVVPQDASLPASAYQIIDDQQEHTHSGPSGLKFARLQFTHHASTYSEVYDVKAAVEASIDGKRRGLGSVNVQSVESQSARDGWSETHEAPVVRQDFLIWYQED